MELNKELTSGINILTIRKKIDIIAIGSDKK